MRELVVYSTYYLNESVLSEIKRIRQAELPFIISSDVPLQVRNIPINHIDISVLPYARHRLWYNIEFHLLLAQQVLPGFDYYWYIEHDIRYTGDWPELFKTAFRSKADYLAVQLRSQAQDPKWPKWSMAPDGCKALHASLMPIFRMSSIALDYLRRCYLLGRIGYCEVSVPSLVVDTGLVIDDLKNCGIPYSTKTLTWIPKPRSVKVDYSVQSLFHPVRTKHG